MQNTYRSRLQFCWVSGKSLRDKVLLLAMTLAFSTLRRLSIFRKTLLSERIYNINTEQQGSSVSLSLRLQDVPIYFEIWHYQAYKINIPCEFRNVFDIGANIGIATIYFLDQHGGSRVSAYEPAVKNFEILNKNIASISRAVAVPNALTPKNMIVHMKDENFGYNATISEDQKGYPVQGITMLEILRGRYVSGPTLVKIDIEGAEKKIFESDLSWLAMIDYLIIETHGTDIELLIQKSMLNAGFQRVKVVDSVSHFQPI